MTLYPEIANAESSRENYYESTLRAIDASGLLPHDPPEGFVKWLAPTPYDGLSAELEAASTGAYVAGRLAVHLMNMSHTIENQNSRTSLLEQRLAETSIDIVTGLWTRRKVEKDWRGLQMSSLNGSSAQSHILILDLDHFKQVNDTYGHKAGDTELRRVGETIKRNTRDRDISGRLGGDEFVIILPRTTTELAIGIAEAIRDDVEQTKSHLQSVSIGVSKADFSQSFDDAIEKADKALYESKRKGRNKVSFHR